jgi:hypothetical protein
MGSDGFHYIVLFRLRAGVTLRRVRTAREQLAALVETLPGVRQFVVTDNIAESSQGYTLALISQFEDRRAYEIFDRHPEARSALESLSAVVDQRIVVQGAG